MANYIRFSLVLFSSLHLSAALAATDYVRMINDNYDPEVTVVSKQLKTKNSNSKCNVYEVKLSGTDPLNFEKRTIQLDFYEPVEKKSGLGSVIVLPAVTGVSPLDQWSSNRFCKSGLHTALVYGWEFFSENKLDWETHDRGSLRAITATRHVLEYVLQERPGPVGIQGTSQGALFASFALGVDPRLTTGVLIVGGGPISAVIGRSDLTALLQLKKARMQFYHLKNDEEYEAELAHQIQIDNISLAKDAGPKNLWMFIATHDKTVPIDTQWKLWQTWKEPKHTDLHLAHVGAIIKSFFFYHHAIRDYFIQNLQSN
jgi:hypothetical protein